MEESETIKQCVELQLMEIEMLEAMFPEENEFALQDPALLIDARDFCNSESDKISDYLRQIAFDINVAVNTHVTESEYQDKESRSSTEQGRSIVKIHFILPLTYPYESPEVFVSSDGFSREGQGKLNKMLKDFIAELEKGEIHTFPIIEWIKEASAPVLLENLSSECSPCQNSNNSDATNSTRAHKSYFSRMWLYMHHIYSKGKRRNIKLWAHDLGLTGFSLPGKPGVVYVEGHSKSVDEYFVKLRGLNWQKMSCRHRDTVSSIDNEDLRKFQEFKELVFDVHGPRENHMDMGQFSLFLKEHGLGHMFPILFGIESKEKGGEE